MASKKGKKMSAYQTHKQQQRNPANNPKKTNPKITKSHEKWKGKTKIIRNKKMIIEETESDNVTVVSLKSGCCGVRNEIVEDTMDIKGDRGEMKYCTGKVAQTNKQQTAAKKKLNTDFVVVADDASVMLVETQQGNVDKDNDVHENVYIVGKESMQKADNNGGKRKKRKRKQRKEDKDLTGSEHTKSTAASSRHYEPPMGLTSKECFTAIEKQRNPPKFESESVKSKYNKNLEKELKLNKEQVEVRRKMLLEVDAPAAEKTTDIPSDTVVYDKGEMIIEGSDSESEDLQFTDFVSGDTSEDDIMESLEQQEALFKVFGHDQVELGSCGAFGSGSTNFKFHGKEDLQSNVEKSPGDVIHEHSERNDMDDFQQEQAGKNQNDGQKLKKGRNQRKTRGGKSELSEQDVCASVQTKHQCEERTNKLECLSLSLPKEEATVVVLAHPQELCIQGKALVTMLTGEMDIMGHRLQPDKSYKVYSPLSNSYAVLKTIDGKDSRKIISEKLSSLLGNQEVEMQLKAFKEENCVSFLVRPLDLESHNYLSSMSPYNGLFSIRTDEPLKHNINLLPLGFGLFPREFVMRPWITLSKDIRQILDLWETMLERGDKSATDRSPVILVCGGKNSGKSTLNRHLVNTALNKLGEVSYLELDVGQTEFSPPGCVSFYTVTEPVLGPPFTHLRKAERMCYYGGVTASVNVTLYTRCVEYVFAAYRGDTPLIINTMGWNKGIGLKLLVDVLHITNPDIVIQINTYKSTDNFPPITPLFKLVEEGWLYNTQDQENMLEQDKAPLDSHELCVVQTPVRKMQEKFITWTAADHRNVTLLSYFCDGLKSGQTLLSLPPYTVPWNAVAVHVCNAAEVQPSQTLLVLNGSIVGMCQTDLPEDNDNDDCFPRLLTTFPMCQCLGFGLVRGIDPEMRLFYIVTSLTLDDLAKVNVLVKGSLMLPDQVSKQQKISQHRPYWDNLTPSLGSWKTTYKERKMRRPGAVFRSRHQ